MPDSAEVLARLRSNAPDGPVPRLARLAVDDVLARPVGELVDAKLVAATALEALRSLAASDAAEKTVAARIDAALADLDAVKKPVSTLIPAALRDGARALAAAPMTPKHDAVLKLLDRDPLKQLLRGQILDTLIAFGRKAASPVADSSIAKGLGGIGKLASGLASASPLGRVASAVSGEVERQMEKRASDFADTAVAGVLEGIAQQASDPARAKEQAALRVALLDGLLELTGADHAAVARGHVGPQVAAARKAIDAWTKDPAFLADVERAVTKAIEKETARPLGDVLADLAIRDAAAEHARTLVTRVLTHLVAGDPFATWLAELLA